ncbi:beta-lactamase family protein [Myxococcus sp. K15C18031901]|uniref:serine hydrolase domain-containing protein n=1 Tax=Myxococcus dinghuensis TaxID=2906761 RepID=UPI0020A776C5|nr:serine hydrolase domain-containing protein [Myxococcus dinghuensis]MCP3104630.1 beta-lactamase family protein [Myxococcus dinghuensis]
MRVGAAVLVVNFTGARDPSEEMAANDVELLSPLLGPVPSTLAPLDRAALRQVIAGPVDSGACAAQVRVSGPEGRWLGTSGLADLRTGAPVPADGRFRIGALTQTFTATVVLQLAAERRVDLERPIQHYLPGLLPPTHGLVTVRQLLDHTHGLAAVPHPARDPAWFFENRFRRWTPREVVALALAQGPHFTPGTRQEEGDTGYFVAGLLIEKLTGRPFAQAVRERLLAPLHLRDTSVPGNDPTLPGPHARGYESIDDGDGARRHVDVTEANASWAWAAGEMISSTADLDTFLVALFRGGLLPEAQLEELFTVPDVPLVGGGQALHSAGLTRWTLEGLTLWGQRGASPGYVSGMLATRDVRRRLIYSLNTLHMARTRPALADRIVRTAFTPRAAAT